jgi:hypothetical protein
MENLECTVCTGENRLERHEIKGERGVRRVCHA